MSFHYHKPNFLPTRFFTQSPHCQLFNNSNIIHTDNINVTSKSNFLLHKSASFSPYQCHRTFSFTLIFCRTITAYRNQTTIAAEFYNSLPSFDFPITKLPLQICHPSPTPLHYGNNHKAENVHSSNTTVFCLQS